MAEWEEMGGEENDARGGNGATKRTIGREVGNPHRPFFALLSFVSGEYRAAFS